MDTTRNDVPREKGNSSSHQILGDLAFALLVLGIVVVVILHLVVMVAG